jgi:glucose-1-phosphate adenylyltransferase
MRFAEKPPKPEPMPGRDDVALVSMGIYIFGREFLKEQLTADAENPNSAHDFGKNIIPGAIHTSRVYAYPFQDVKTDAQAYWRDVGTVDAFYEANMELVYVTPELNLYDEEWPIWTYQEHVPSAKFVLDEEGRRGQAINSLVSGGCIISGAIVRESLMFVSSVVDERSEVYRSVLLPHVQVGKSCTIRRAILDEGCVIPDGTRIGVDLAADKERFYVTAQGVVLVTPDMLAAPPAAAQKPVPRMHVVEPVAS